MVAVEITDGKVYVGAAAAPPLHPAALMFPTGGKLHVEGLMAAIAERGLQEPITLTPNGELLEGRGRWRACRRLEIVPATRVERSDPWLFILARNRDYLLSLEPNHRAMIAGRIPRWGRAGRPTSKSRRYEDPPTLEGIAKAADVPRHAVGRAQTIFSNGVGALSRLVIEGRCPIYTAVRISELPSPEQEVFVNRVMNGESTRLIAPLERRHGDERRDRSRATIFTERAPIRNRNQYLRKPAIRQLVDALASMRMIEAAAEGLDPTITPEEAADFVRELASQHVAYRHVIDLLRQRKDDPS